MTFKLRPEITSLKYWIHIGIIGFIILALLQIFSGGNMLTWNNWLYSLPITAVSDIIAHTFLGFD